MMLTLGRLQERVTQSFVDAEANVEAAEPELLAEEAAAGSSATDS